MQPFVFLPIHPALQHLLESIVVMNFDFAKSDIETVYQYPWSAKAHIFFRIDENPFLVKTVGHKDFSVVPPNLIMGARLKNDIVNLGGKKHFVVITFKPSGLFRFTGIPLHEITNIDIDASAVFGSEIEEVEMRLKEAGNNLGIKKVIEDFFLKRLFKTRPMIGFDEAINLQTLYRGNIPIEKLAHYANISIRQFERQCYSRLGVSPKLFSKLTRFATAYLLKEKNPELNWLDIAYEAGYYDQSHFIRDFKAFSGYTPAVAEAMLSNSIKIMTALEGKE